MINDVLSRRCKCGVSVKVVSETDPDIPMAKPTVKCPACLEEQTLTASTVLSITQDQYMEERRFRVGDVVSITDRASPCYGEEGRVLAVLVNKHAGKPDKYDVVFADGRSEAFWDAQLRGKS